MKSFVAGIVTILLALPLCAGDLNSGDARTVDVMIDLPRHRAYIPYGTVLPAGATLRVKAYRGPTIPAKVQGDLWAGASSFALSAESPLIFEYVPESRFADLRKQSRSSSSSTKRRFATAPLYRPVCFVHNFGVGVQGYYDTYMEYFTSSNCFDADARPPDYDTMYFLSSVTAEDYTAAWITDLLGNYTCYASGEGVAATCNSWHTSQILTYIANTVWTRASAYHLEWVDGNPSYVGVEFEWSYDILQE